MRTVKLMMLAMLAGPVLADTRCQAVIDAGEHTLEYFACLQEQLAAAELKAKIKESEDKLKGNGQLPPGKVVIPNNLFPGEMPEDLKAPAVNRAKLPLYVGYSASEDGQDAIVSYGGTETRVKQGSVLPGGWRVDKFNAYSLTVRNGNSKRIIPLTITQ